MPMRATTVRFDESLWAMLEREARAHGVSAAQFVRDATVLRIASVATQRGDEDMLRTVADVAARSLRTPSAPPPAGSPPAAAAAAGPAGAAAPAGAAPSADSAAPPEPVPPAAVTDPERLAALERSGMLDVRDDPAFDRLTRLAARVVDAPVALVSLVDRDRQVFASCVGLEGEVAEARQTPLSQSFCQHAVAAREPLVVDDARKHPVLKSNRAIEDLGIIAYAGIPLIDDEGHALGTLCVADARPRTWSTADVDLLADLAASALTEIKLRQI